MNVLILTPLALERAAVLRHLKDVRTEQRGNNLYDIGKFSGQHQEYTIVVRKTGPKHAVISAAFQEAATFFKPEIALLLGICGGIKDVDLGDVVVATWAYNYDGGKIDDTGNFASRPNNLPFSKELITAAELTDQKNQWQRRLSANTWQHKVVFGPIASGDKVIASKESELYKRIKQYFNDTTAVEMESHGFAQAAYNHHPDIRILNIRGVSDLIDHKSSTDATGTQEKAADVSAAFAIELLYCLNSSPFMTSTMDTKTLAKELYNRLIPAALQGFGNADQSELRTVWAKVEPLIQGEMKDLRDNPEDADVQADVRNRLRKELTDKEDLQRELISFLERAKPAEPSISIENSKNVIVGSTINAGGNVRLGDGDSINGSGDAIKGNKTVVNNHYYGPDPNRNHNNLSSTPSNNEIAKPTSEIITSLQELVARGRSKEAIPKLKQLVQSNNPALHEPVIQLSERWKEFERKSLMGMLSNSEQNVERAQITATLLALIGKLQDED